MGIEARDKSIIVPQTRLIPVGDLVLLTDAALGLPDTSIKVLKRAGGKYGSMVIVDVEEDQTRHLGRENRVVRRGEVLVSIRTDAHNFGPLEREFNDLKEARAERERARAVS